MVVSTVGSAGLVGLRGGRAVLSGFFRARRLGHGEFLFPLRLNLPWNHTLCGAALSIAAALDGRARGL